jgi:hypothetical protein
MITRPIPVWETPSNPLTSLLSVITFPEPLITSREPRMVLEPQAVINNPIISKPKTLKFFVFMINLLVCYLVEGASFGKEYIGVWMDIVLLSNLASSFDYGCVI